MNNKLDIKKRLIELSDRSFNENRYVFTDFLGMSELSEYYTIRKELAVDSEAFGGIESAERCIIRFGSPEQLGYSMPYPIKLLLIKPVNKKFSDILTHRDFLGSIIGLGLEREKIGDIFVFDNNSCYIFIQEGIAEYVIENLTYVKHTRVDVETSESVPEDMGPKLMDDHIIVSSNRLDAIIARVYNMSREKSVRLIQDSKVFINGILSTENALSLKDGSVVSVRGFGRFVFVSEGGKTRKDKLYIDIKKYVT